jgi:hypothetical protein
MDQASEVRYDKYGDVIPTPLVALERLVDDSHRSEMLLKMIDEYFVAANVDMPETGEDITVAVYKAIKAADDDGAFATDEGMNAKVEDLLKKLKVGKLAVTLSLPHHVPFPIPKPTSPSRVCVCVNRACSTSALKAVRGKPQPTKKRPRRSRATLRSRTLALRST